jgi:hypothetical protein
MSFGEKGTDGTAVRGGCWSSRRIAGKHCRGRAFARCRPSLLMSTSKLIKWGWNSISKARRTAAARGAARSGGVYIRSAVARRARYGGLRLNFRTRHVLRSGPRSYLPTLLSSSQYPPSMVGCLMRCARVIASTHRSRRPLGRVNHKERVRANGRYSKDQPVPATYGGCLVHDKRDGRCDRRQPFAAMAISYLPRREGET